MRKAKFYRFSCKFWSKHWKRTFHERHERWKIRHNKKVRLWIRNWQREHHGSQPNLSVIPKNSDYCDNCPYAYQIEILENELENHPGIVATGQTMIGGCRLMKLTDDDMKGFGLLWDGVKECGINIPTN